MAGTYAVGRRVGYQTIDPRRRATEPTLSNGRLILRSGLFRGTPVAVSGAVTAPTVTRELARDGGNSNARRTAMLESLAQALTTFTVAGYSRDGKLDDGALDEALETGFTVLKRMRLEQTWVMKRLAMRRGAAVPMDTRVWSR